VTLQVIFMAKRRGMIPKAPLARIIQRAGAKRVSADAADAFAEVLTEIALEIGEKAVKIAHHSGRKTVHEGDVTLAAR